jgi:hypothetical protein
MQFGRQPVDPKNILDIDTARNEIMKTVSLNIGAVSIHVTSHGKIMVGQYQFDPNAPRTSKEGRLALYDPKTYNGLGKTRIGLLLLTLRWTSDGPLGFVTNIGVDLSSVTVVITLDVDTKPTVAGAMQGSHGMVHFSLKI